MLIESVVAEAFATNCYVVAPRPGSDCIVVDPGIGVGGGLEALLERHRLRPVAVMLTHGHLDHTFSVTPVCGARDIPAYIHTDDEYLLADPLKGLSPDIVAMVGGGLEWTPPQEVATVGDGQTIDVAGMKFTIDHAPGHTPGSVMFRMPGDDDAEAYCLSGDVLFAGSIGRTDFPGGSARQMMESLAVKVLPQADDTVVLPGHGPRTTIGAERRANPFLRQVVDSLDGSGDHTQAPPRGV